MTTTTKQFADYASRVSRECQDQLEKMRQSAAALGIIDMQKERVRNWKAVSDELQRAFPSQRKER
jgi:hypothetical protein